MNRTRGLAIGLVALLACSSLAGLSLGAVPDNRVTVTDTTVEPSNPVAGAPATISATIRLSGGSDAAASLESVEIVDDGESLGEATNLGSLSPGETLTVPVTVRFEDPGARNVTVVVTVVDDDGETTTVRRPVSVVVESGSPQLEVDAGSLVAGADSGAAVTVSNPTTAPIRDITVSFLDTSGDRTRRTLATLAAGASQELNFSLRPADAGERVLAVEVSYTTAAGTRNTMTHERTVQVEPLDDDVGVRVEEATTAQQNANGDGGGVGGLAGALGGGGTLQSSSDGEDQAGQQQTGVAVTVTNFGNAPIEEVVLVPRHPNGSAVSQLGRVAVAGSLAPGESEQVTLDLTTVRASSLRFVADYELGGDSQQAVGEYQLDRSSGAVSLTGMNVSVEGNQLRLSGNLGNVGDGDVRGVVVSVASSEYVEPAYPQRNYFVGTVGPSEFAPFELTAQVDTANASSLPVRVEYTTAGERRVETIEVALPADAGTAERGGALGSLGGTALGAGIGLVLGVPAAGFVLRRYR
jgi:hypothetical protein